MYVYRKMDHGLYTVGFYDPKGTWHAESDHNMTESAAARTNYLNGGAGHVYGEEKPVRSPPVRWRNIAGLSE